MEKSYGTQVMYEFITNTHLEMSHMKPRKEHHAAHELWVGHPCATSFENLRSTSGFEFKQSSLLHKGILSIHSFSL